MNVFQRLREMDGTELRFRLASQTRQTADRALASLSRPAWHRSDLARLLRPEMCRASIDLEAAQDALNQGEWTVAHSALARHFSQRSPRFVVAPQNLRSLSKRIRAAFPDSEEAARQAAERMLRGHYDVLGYENVEFGVPPDWHLDPVHSRRAVRRFWADVSYLDPSQGDHKIIWELNRHQHWLRFARAFHLAGDRRYYSAVVTQLANWMAVNPPLHGVNWASMLEIGLRSLSWVWTLHFFALEATQDSRDESPWIVDLLIGLNRQLLHVERNLSLYFSPNTHLSGEALALYVAGQTLPELRSSSRWAELGRQVLFQEIDRQILPDGGHAERSAHYHRYTTDFHLLALLVARTTEDPAAVRFEAALRRLSQYLRAIADDRGRMPLVGDDDGGQLFPICERRPWDCRDTLAAAGIVLQDPSLAVGEPPEEAYWLSGGAEIDPAAADKQLPWSSTALPDSGYYVSRTRRGDHLVFDAGPHGFLNGGHAHADALAISLTVRGQPLLVDAGTANYTMDPELRDLLRSTAMHNTVVVNDRSQSQPRGAFHWQTSTDAHATLWRSEEHFDYAEGRHDGYAPVVHARGVLALHGFGWVIVDHLLGSGEAHAETMWHFHPDWHVEQQGHALAFRSGALSGHLAGSTELSLNARGDDLSLHSPVYGLLQRGHCARVRTAGALPESWLTFIWIADGRSEAEQRVKVERLPLVAKPEDWCGAAFRIWTPGRQVLVLSAVPSIDEGADSKSPSQPWGCDSLQTDGRLAVVDAGGDDRMAIRIGGTMMTLASSVHS